MRNGPPPQDRELALHLEEFDDVRGGRLVRLQAIGVIRNDEPAIFIEALGGSEKFPGAMPFKILSALQDSVAELRDLANEYRENKFMVEALRERAETSTLLEDMYADREQRAAFAKQNARTLTLLKDWTNRD